MKARGPFFQVLFDWRDLWLGVYWTGWKQDGWRCEFFDVYVCLLPALPIRLRWYRP